MQRPRRREWGVAFCSVRMVHTRIIAGLVLRAAKQSGGISLAMGKWRQTFQVAHCGRAVRWCEWRDHSVVGALDERCTFKSPSRYGTTEEGQRESGRCISLTPTSAQPGSS
jgi:hypothetical protein